MWNRKKFKENGKKNFRLNYKASVCVCFIMAIIAGRYSTTTTALRAYNKAADTARTVVTRFSTETPSDALKSIFLDEEKPEKPPSGDKDENKGFRAVIHAASTVFNNIVKSESYLVNIVSGLSDFIKGSNFVRAVIYVLTGLISFLYSVFIANLLYVGERRFFMELRTYKNTRIGRIGFLFKLKKIINPAKIMLLRQIFNGLWYLTIIMGPYKYYEYRMIPFILAEDPDIKRKDAFLLSKQLMRGNKFKMFKLDISFFWWYVLIFLSLGLVGFFYVNPYIVSTKTEVYMALRRNAIENKEGLYKCFKDRYLDPVTQEEVQNILKIYNKKA